MPVSTTQESAQPEEEMVISNAESSNEKNEIQDQTMPTVKSDSVRSSSFTEETMNDDKSILMEENERLKSERLCVICLSKDKNVLFLPCAHLAACLDCSFNLQTCPICRSKIQATVRTFS